MVPSVRGDSDRPVRGERALKLDKSHLSAIKRGSKVRAKGCVSPPRVPPAEIVQPEPGHPTWYEPGSAEKVCVMAARRLRLESLCHPYDARYVGDPRPYFFTILDEGERGEIVARVFTKYWIQSPMTTLV